MVCRRIHVTAECDSTESRAMHDEKLHKAIYTSRCFFCSFESPVSRNALPHCSTDNISDVIAQ